MNHNLATTHQDPVLLGIDFGTVRIGVARSYGSLAEPLTILENDDQIFSQLRQLCQEHQVTQIVVGVSEGAMAEQTEVFIEKLRQQITLPIVTNDETLTSWSAEQKLRQVKSQPRRQHVDALAAAEMLQDYLDTQP